VYVIWLNDTSIIRPHFQAVNEFKI